MDEQVRRNPEQISSCKKLKLNRACTLFQAVDGTRVALVVLSCLGSTMVSDDLITI